MGMMVVIAWGDGRYKSTSWKGEAMIITAISETWIMYPAINVSIHRLERFVYVMIQD